MFSRGLALRVYQEFMKEGNNNSPRLQVVQTTLLFAKSRVRRPCWCGESFMGWVGN